MPGKKAIKRVPRRNLSRTNNTSNNDNDSIKNHQQNHHRHHYHHSHQKLQGTWTSISAAALVAEYGFEGESAEVSRNLLVASGFVPYTSSVLT
eukprot:m.256246 g.256246  ORF g.256246 m.256246 type:complete len:93 (-) comp54554_c1_seq9:464-742(-)